MLVVRKPQGKKERRDRPAQDEITEVEPSESVRKTIHRAERRSQKGRLQEAAAVLTEAVDKESDPQQVIELVSVRCSVHLSNHKLSDALTDAQKCVSARPAWGHAFLLKAQALSALKRHTEARDCLRLAAVKDVRNVKIQVALSQATAACKMQEIKHNLEGDDDAESQERCKSAMAVMSKTIGDLSACLDDLKLAAHADKVRP
eukprot:2259396-Rhodomonas_salina.3